MGLFTKRPEPSDPAEEPRTLVPPAQTVQSQVPAGPPGRGAQVRVTAADPHGPPQQVIERRAPEMPVVVPVPSAPPPPLPVQPRFSIEDAVRLLRELPARESIAVREAVQKTLEFMNVDLERLVEDATTKDHQLEARATSLQREVEQHEALALAAKKQIAAIEGERAELEATKAWMLEHRAQQGEPIPLERVVRGTPASGPV